jgi:hypothetical protein
MSLEMHCPWPEVADNNATSPLCAGLLGSPTPARRRGSAKGFVEYLD